MKIKPDIFVILAESVWDPRRLDALQGIADPMPYFHRKMDENGGYVEVPAYGGGTPKTEFEVLTGLSSLEIGGYPYVAALYRPTRSLATVFAKHGYQTRYAHAYKEWMFNRGNAIPRMGFERAYFEKELRQLAKIPPRPDTYFDDHSFLQFLCALPQGDKPFFVAAATYGTHGPYADRPVAAEKLPGHIAMHRKDAASLAKNLALLHRFDLALKSFSDCLRARKRPAVFMVYGDHWPNYSYFDFSLIWSDAPASAYTETPYFIAAENFRLPKLNAGFTSTNWLHLDILEAAGAGDDFVARELRQLRTALPVLGVYKLDRKKLVKQFGPSAFVESQLGQYRELTDAVMHLGLGL